MSSRSLTTLIKETAVVEATKAVFLVAGTSLLAAAVVWRRYLRELSREEVALWVAIALLLGFVVWEARKRVRQRRKPASAVLAAPAVAVGSPSEIADEPLEPLVQSLGVYSSRSLERVDVGDWIPELAFTEHAGAMWTTTMSPIPYSPRAESYITPPDDLGVRSPPLCKTCGTDLMIRRDSARRINELYCVGCGWTQLVHEGLSMLERQATAKVRGAYRRILAGGPPPHAG